MKERAFGSTLVLALLVCYGPARAQAAKVPIGKELAPPEIGKLIRADVRSMQTNPLAAGGEAYIWECVYQVGRAQITTLITTAPGGAMPCKRKVMFGDPQAEQAKGQ